MFDAAALARMNLYPVTSLRFMSRSCATDAWPATLSFLTHFAQNATPNLREVPKRPPAACGRAYPAGEKRFDRPGKSCYKFRLQKRGKKVT
jgi:hypothetical protein